MNSQWDQLIADYEAALKAKAEADATLQRLRELEQRIRTWEWLSRHVADSSTQGVIAVADELASILTGDGETTAATISESLRSRLLTLPPDVRNELYRFTLHMFINANTYPALHRFISTLRPVPDGNPIQGRGTP